MKMAITINPYRKKDGSLMLYVNKYNNMNRGVVSVGISNRVLLTKLTKGERKLLDLFLEELDKVNGIEFTDSNFEAHLESKAELDFGIKILITDVANCGGIGVGSDGLYIYYKNKLIASEDVKVLINRVLNDRD